MKLTNRLIRNAVYVGNNAFVSPTRSGNCRKGNIVKIQVGREEMTIGKVAVEYCWGGDCRSSFLYLGNEVIIMETLLEILREVLKGIVREVCTYFIRKNVLENKKTTPRRHKHGWFA
jgi:hypothetical protein